MSELDRATIYQDASHLAASLEDIGMEKAALVVRDLLAIRLDDESEYAFVRMSIYRERYEQLMAARPEATS